MIAQTRTVIHRHRAFRYRAFRYRAFRYRVFIWLLCGLLPALLASGCGVLSTLFNPIASTAVAMETTEMATETVAMEESRQPALPRLSLVFIGDIMAHRPNFSMEDYDAIYEHTRDHLRAADISFANLEAPVAAQRAYHTWPRFSVQPPYVQAAIDGGVDLFSVANNHSADWGVAGVAATREALLGLQRQVRREQSIPIDSFNGVVRKRNRAVAFAGLRGRPSEELQLLTIRRRGWRIGLIAVTQFQNAPHDGGGLVQVVDYRLPAQAAELLRRIEISAPYYDLLVVSYHAGLEYQIQSDERKADYFRQLVAAGADVVWGHHPHVLQPQEVIERPDGRRALIMYSTGNFVSGQTWLLGPQDAERPRADTGDSALFRVQIRRLASGADVVHARPLFISNLRVRPSDGVADGAADRAGLGGVVVRPLQALAGAEELTPEWRDYYRRRLQKMLFRFGDRPCGRCMSARNPNLLR